MRTKVEMAVAAAVEHAMSETSLRREARRMLQRKMPFVVTELIIDLAAYAQRDPAVGRDPWLVLRADGYRSLVRHRVSHRMWTQAAGLPPEPGRAMREGAFELMNRAKHEYGVELHPGAELSAPFVLDHAGENVVSEFARTGPGLYMLQGVAIVGMRIGLWPPGVIGETVIALPGCCVGVGVVLGGSHIGKNRPGARHPVLGANVELAAGVQVLGRVEIGYGVRIGAFAVVKADVGTRSIIETGALIEGRVGSDAFVGARARVPRGTTVPDGGRVLPGAGWSA